MRLFPGTFEEMTIAFIIGGVITVDFEQPRAKQPTVLAPDQWRIRAAKPKFTSRPAPNSPVVSWYNTNQEGTSMGKAEEHARKNTGSTVASK